VTRFVLVLYWFPSSVTISNVRHRINSGGHPDNWSYHDDNTAPDREPLRSKYKTVNPKNTITARTAEKKSFDCSDNVYMNKHSWDTVEKKEPLSGLSEMKGGET
jgi:hypothetical protein